MMYHSFVLMHFIYFVSNILYETDTKDNPTQIIQVLHVGFKPTTQRITKTVLTPAFAVRII